MASYPTIKLGSSGEAVSTWQGLLSKAGVYTDVTGKFDQATHEHTKSWQAQNGLVVDGIVGPASWSKMTGVTVTPPAGTDKNAQYGRDALLKAWPLILAEAAQSQYPEVQALAAMGSPNLSELQIAGAMAHLESSYGKSPYTNKATGETKVLNNWGAVQAGKPPCNPATSFEVTDSGAQGSYNYCYKLYPTPEAGALDFLRLLTVKRPHSWAAMKTGDIDEYSLRMHSWNPPLTALGQGKAPGAVHNLDPITKVPGYFEQPPIAGKNSRAAGLESRVGAIANTLGEKVMAKRGGPIDAGGVEPNGGGMTTTKKVATVGSVAFLLAAAWAAWEAFKRW